MNFIEPYSVTVLVVGAVGLLLLLQLIIVDVVALKEKKPAGFPVAPDQKRLLFRVIRAHENSNESVAIFILFVLFGIFSSAEPVWLNFMSCVYLVGRVGHMGFYYAGVSRFRSLSFGISLAGLLGMLVVGLVACL